MTTIGSQSSVPQTPQPQASQKPEAEKTNPNVSLRIGNKDFDAKVNDELRNTLAKAAADGQITTSEIEGALSLAKTDEEKSFMDELLTASFSNEKIEDFLVLTPSGNQALGAKVLNKEFDPKQLSFQPPVKGKLIASVEGSANGVGTTILNSKVGAQISYSNNGFTIQGAGTYDFKTGEWNVNAKATVEIPLGSDNNADKKTEEGTKAKK